jgi:Ser/Thr protein kinase RdoA (MazF antagonist)
MKDNHTLWADLARQALAEYGLQACSFAFIQHSDNVTFRVEKPNSEAFLLRIHQPVVTTMGTHGADLDALNSELLWLEALNQDTDLILQRPVRNQAGELVTRLYTGDGTGSIYCTLLHWLAGQAYHRDLQSEFTAWQIGAILAKLHLHASQWKIPPGFKRPKRDIAYFESVLNGLKPALADGRIKPADFRVFETSIGLLSEMMGLLAENRQVYGVIHADAHKGNMLYHNGEIRLIDFSFCAMGNYMFDLGVCFSDMEPVLHHVFLKSYQEVRCLSDSYQRLVEGFFIGSMVGTFSFWIPNPHAQKLLISKVPQIAKDYAVKFNCGESFWF